METRNSVKAAIQRFTFKHEAMETARHYAVWSLREFFDGRVGPAELAAKLCITEAHLQRILKGKRSLTVDLAKKIAGVL